MKPNALTMSSSNRAFLGILAFASETLIPLKESSSLDAPILHIAPSLLRAHRASCYTGAMQDEQEFRRAAENALDELKRHLIEREEEVEAGFEVEEQGGVLNVVFEEPAVKFVITPNTPVRQIWISALSTSFKLDWNPAAATFVLARTNEKLIPLVDR